MSIADLSLKVNQISVISHLKSLSRDNIQADCGSGPGLPSLLKQQFSLTGISPLQTELFLFLHTPYRYPCTDFAYKVRMDWYPVTGSLVSSAPWNELTHQYGCTSTVVY